MHKRLSLLVSGRYLSLAPLGLAQGHTDAMPCTTVQGRYGIYADGDRLWVTGSRHLIEVVSDELDAELEKRGWESTYAYGQFTICARAMSDPRQLTIRDQVVLKGFKQIEFRSR